MPLKVIHPGDPFEKTFRAADQDDTVYFFDLEEYIQPSIPNPIGTAVNDIAQKVAQAFNIRWGSEDDASPIITVVEPREPLWGEARQQLGQAGAFVIPRPRDLYNIDVSDAGDPTISAAARRRTRDQQRSILEAYLNTRFGG